MKTPLPNNRRTTHPLLTTLLVLLVFITGCASVDLAPFTEFSSSLHALRTGSDTQARAAADASRHDLIQKVASLEVSPADLQLEFDSTDPFTSTYGFAQNEPNFVKLIRFRHGLSVLNEAMVAYARSLVILAGGGQGGDILPTTAQFDQLARDLNANAGTAAAALGVSLDPGNQALLSTAAIQLFKAYIESRRREALAEAIAEVQLRVAAFSTAAKQAVRFLTLLVITDYNKKFLPLVDVSPPNATPILVLNDTIQATLATLESLSTSYGALPAAHRDLSAAASRQLSTLAGLIALTEEATRLQRLVTELAEANSAAARASTPATQ